MNTSSEPFLSCRVVNIMLQTAEANGVDIEPILLENQIHKSQLAEEDQMFSLAVVRALFLACSKQLKIDSDHYAFECGRHANLNSYGPIGITAMSEQTFGDAIDTAVEYLELIAPSFVIEKQENTESLKLTLLSKTNFDKLSYRFILFFLVGSCKEMIKTLFGASDFPTLKDIQINLAIEEIDLLLEDHDLSNFTINFKADSNGLVLPNWLTPLPTALANKFAAEKFREECDQIREKMQSSFSAYLRKRISESEYSFPSQDEIAKELNVSSRSFHRALTEENTSYRNILTQIKMSRASELLKLNTLNVTQISDKLGYSDSANFSKAFKSFYGVSPKQYVQKDKI